MAILVTGGAGFIGSNFVLEWLGCGSEPVVVLDKLTYAGNLDNLAEAMKSPRHRFVRGDIGHAPTVKRLLPGADAAAIGASERAAWNGAAHRTTSK